MIEANNPEINVDELMQKIREEVANRHGQSGSTGITSNAEKGNMTTTISHIEALLKNAESRAYIRTKWPDKLNRFPFNLTKKIPKVALKIINFLFKDQREVNFNLIQSLKESVALNRQLIEQIATLRAQMDEHLCAVDTRLQGMDEHLCAVDTRLQGMDEHLCAVDTRLQGMDEHLCAMDTRLQGMDESFNTIDSWMSSWMTGTQERLDAVDMSIQGLDQHLGTVNSQVQGLDQRYIKNDSYLKNDLMQQKRLIALFLEEARHRLPEPFNQEQLQAFVKQDEHSLDAFYVAFEDQFRGSQEDIRNRLKVYLPLIEEAKIGTPESPILDVGCGRGEWLELLQESGYEARGLDINRVMLEECRYRGLEVIERDVIAYLQSLPNASLGGITGFHIIEHLPFATLIKLFDETIRVLVPGGLAIFETPNPENVLVGSHTFYIDPTHRNPLPNIMVKFIAESRGLSRVTITNLHPYPDEFRLTGSEIAEKVSNYFYGPQDYAVIGYKL